MAVYALGVATLCALIVLLHLPDIVLGIAIIPIPLAAVWRPRWVYATMLAIAAPLAVWVVGSISTNQAASMGAVAVFVLSVVLASEAIRRMIARQVRLQDAARQAEEQVQRQNQYLSALGDVTLALLNRQPLPELLKNIVLYAAQLIGTPHGYLYLLAPGDDRIEIKVGIGDSAAFAGLRLKRGEGIAGEVWQTGQPVVANDYSHYAGRLSQIAPADFQAIAGVPLRIGADVAGVLGLCYSEPGRVFTDAEVDILSRLAHIASIALDHAHLNEAVQQELAERQHAEQELRAQRDFALQVMNNMGQGLTVVDAQGRFDFVNRAYERMIGCAPGALAGRMPTDVTEQVDHAVLVRARADRAEGKTTSYETRLRRLDGGNVYAFITSVPRWRDGKVDGAIAVITDLTERRRMEETLRNSEEAIRSLYEIASSPLGFPDKISAMLAMGRQRYGLENGALARVDGDRYEVMSAQSSGNVLKTGMVLDLGQVYCRETLLSGVVICFEHASASEWRHHPCYAATGLEAYIGAPVVVGGAIYGALNFTSVRPREKPFQELDRQFLQLMAQWIGAEIEREQHTRQLEAYAAEIEMKNVDLAAARDQALEVSRLKSDFLATVSHEIRTPMNAIIGMTELLLDTPLESEQHEFAATVLSSADLLLGIINDILDFSKIEAGKIIVERIDCDTGDVVRQVVDTLASRAAQKNLELACRLADGTPARFVGDPLRIRQVLLNLVGNAVKFTDAGQVTVGVAVEGGRLRFSVRDTGIGLSQAALDRLFQPFSQADSSVTRRYGGTGLGLVICKRLVELMGGQIGVESVEGSGSTFWFDLPLNIGPAAPAAGAGPSAPAPLAAARIGRRVLLVEDNAVNRKLALIQLGKLGCQVDAVEDGQAAVESVTQHPGRYALVFMDCQMPGMDGYTATRAIRGAEQRLGLPRTTIIAMTAGAMEADRQRSREAGMDDHLSKPVKLDRLARAVDLWLSAPAGGGPR